MFDLTLAPQLAGALVTAELPLHPVAVHRDAAVGTSATARVRTHRLRVRVPAIAHVLAVRLAA